MILLDTNILSELMNPIPSPAVVEFVNKTPSNEAFICVVTRAEIELGIALMPEGKRRNTLRTNSLALFDMFKGRCLPFEERAATIYAQLFATRKRSGRPMSKEDAQIAAIALTHDFIVATRNSKNFQGIQGLTLINPWFGS